MHLEGSCCAPFFLVRRGFGAALLPLVVNIQCGTFLVVIAFGLVGSGNCLPVVIPSIGLSTRARAASFGQFVTVVSGPVVVTRVRYTRSGG